jgi:hypothetical protein
VILSENLPNFVAVWMIRLDEPCAVSASSKSNCVGASRMLGYEFTKIKLLSVDNPVVRVNFLLSTQVNSSQSCALVGGVFVCARIVGILVRLLL